MVWPLVALAVGLAQKAVSDQNERLALKKAQRISGYNHLADVWGGADEGPAQVAAVKQQWADLRRSQAERGNMLGTAIQVLGALDTGGAGDGFDKKTAFAGGDVGSSGGISAGGGHNFDSSSGATENSLDGDSLLKRLDEYGIDYGGRQRLIG